MAIAGGAKPSVEMRISDGQLIVGRVAMRQGVVNSVDVAVQDLLKGKTVFVQQYGDLTERVRRTVEMVLQGRAAGA